jgi:H+/Cl- antiporter ClcA
VAIAIGLLCAVVALVLQRLIFLFTNLFYYQTFSLERHSPIAAAQALGLIAIVIPLVGGLLIGLMARYGSERIRGHGIPEALEAILIGRSRMSPRVAVLKPLSSAISIGSGGPFGAEGPIIMTGGACGSIIAQMMHSSPSCSPTPSTSWKTSFIACPSTGCGGRPSADWSSASAATSSRAPSASVMTSSKIC